MASGFKQRPLGSTGISVSPVGLAGTYRPGKKAVYAAVDEGVNLLFAFGIDTGIIHAAREIVAARRKEIVLITGAYNFIWAAQDVRKTCEKRLRQFRTDYIDVFLFLGVMKPEEFRPDIHEGLLKLKEEGKVRAIGLSCHNRPFLGKLAAAGDVDVLMLRYNAAHRGAEQEVFPHLAVHNPGVISYTATRWTKLLHHPNTLPKGTRVPTAGECYRFVLSNPHVHTVLTGPRNIRQLRENLAAIKEGPLSEEDVAFMRTFGDAVHNQKKWFM